MKLAEEKGIRSIAFLFISNGDYRFPVDRAARIALDIVSSYLEGGSCVEKVIFVLFSDRDYDEYMVAWDTLK